MKWFQPVLPSRWLFSNRRFTKRADGDFIVEMNET
jgi:hypothetical protein